MGFMNRCAEQIALELGPVTQVCKAVVGHKFYMQNFYSPMFGQGRLGEQMLIKPQQEIQTEKNLMGCTGGAVLLQVLQ